MTTPSNRSTHAPKQSATGPFSGSNASLRLEKTKAGIRRSTPDSEALASSDDELDQHHSHQVANTSMPKVTRRTSWLNDVQSGPQRKASLTTASSFSPAGSHPTTPSADQNTWNTNTSPSLSATMSWSHTNTNSFPWGAGIWNSESRKEPPSRLTEVLPSPTSMQSPHHANNFPDEMYSPTSTRTNMGESAIPFAIPLHPTPKTYRSQSYSVGQLEPESTTTIPPKPTGAYSANRGRSGTQYAGLQHRPSRPSMLGELGHDPATLGRVREDEDDEGSVDDEPGGVNWSSNQQRAMEQLMVENAMLRQAASNQLETLRHRDRTASASASSGYQRNGGSKRDTSRVPIIEESSDDDLDDVVVFQPRGSRATGRRFSEHSGNPEKLPTSVTLPENRNLESVKKAHWQTSLGFGGIGEPPQSRRHSFADMPTRHGSISSVSESLNLLSGVNTRAGASEIDEGYGNYAESPLHASQPQLDSKAKHLRARQFAASYFSGPNTSSPGVMGLGVPPNQAPPTLHQAYTMPNSYGRHPNSGMAQTSQNQSLFVVTFKCCRADVFYVQEDTGLQVKPGELVIVEADRGTDLGTVAHANVTWAKAKEMKEYYAEEHYKWLMLFSRQSQTGGPNAVNPNGAPPNFGGNSAVGGMGPQTGHGMQESQTGEMKPKLIKRLAQNHEIQALRDKEGNEAKAKRVCQQKVAEHRLNMEILDAEFQMDWKKLTFYYFADTYINFNSLVTDLFKIYKTRIWMSAINPASFVTPTAGLQPPTAAGPGAMGRESPSDRRRQHENRGYTMPPQQTSPIGYGPQHDTSRAMPYDPYAPFPPMPHHSAGQHGLGLAQYPLQPQADVFPTYNQQSYTTGTLGSGLADLSTTVGQNMNDMRRAHPSHPDWTVNFQGLSLNS